MRELSTIGRLSLPPGQGNVMFPVNSVFRLALLVLRRSGLVVPHPGPPGVARRKCRRNTDAWDFDGAVPTGTLPVYRDSGL